MPRKKTTATTDAPTAVETEAITDAVEAAVEELDPLDGEPIGDEVERAVTETVVCIRSNCQHFTTEQDDEIGLRCLCVAIPNEPPTELDSDVRSPAERCVAPTLMVQVEAWEKLVEHDNGQLAVDVDTDDDVRDQVRERLFNDVLKAQDAVSKAVDKLGDARQAQRAAETFLEKYDAWQADVTATITELKAELREQVSDVNDTSLSDEDVNQDEVEGGESDDTYPGNMLEPGDMGYPEGDDPGEEALANEEPVDAES